MTGPSSSMQVGKVTLVGAGPGDPGLITVRGQECLARADVVLYDALANTQLLQLAPQAECISVGKHGQTPIWTQADINRCLVELAQQGKQVVRLKGGDPAVFARTAEELDVLAAAQIPFEVVPGITAALAAASYVGIPITHRHYSSAVAFITGQQQSGGDPLPIDWDALARFPGTLVFYMGVTTVEEWTTELLQAGKEPSTPTAIVRRCTWSDQTVVRCPLSEVAQNLSPASRRRPPVIVIVGAVAELGRNFDWFSKRPLRGVGVLVTRPIHQSQELTQLLEQAGAEVFHQPVLEISAPASYDSLDHAIRLLSANRLESQHSNAGKVHGLIFSSSNGVGYFLRRCSELGFDSRLFAGVSLAVVGPATANALGKFGLKADVIPALGDEFSAAGLLAELGANVAGERWVVTTTNRSRDTLMAGLAQRGAECIEARSYETRVAQQLSPEVEAAAQAGRLHFVTVTSAQVAEVCHSLLGQPFQFLRPVSLSRQISQRLKELRWPAAVEALQHTSPALVEALVLHCVTGATEAAQPDEPA